VPHALAGAVLAQLGRNAQGEQHFIVSKQIVDASPADVESRLHHYAHLAFACLEQGEIGGRFDDVIACFQSLAIPPERVPFFARHFYLAQAHARLSRCVSSDAFGTSHGDGGRALRAALVELRRAGRTPLFEAHRLLIQGVFEMTRGRSRRAMKLLARAEDIARDIDAPWVLFEAAAHRARHLLRRGNSPASLREARLACHLAEEQGMVQRARDIRSRFLILTRGTSSGLTSSDLSSANLQRQRDALLQVSLVSATITDADEQVRIALDQILEILHAERAFLFLSDGREDRIQLRAARDAHGNDLTDDTTYSREVVDVVECTRQPLVVNSPDGGPTIGDRGTARGLRSIMGAPVMKGDRLVGVIYLDTRIARGVFSEENLKILVAIANHVYVTLEATRMAQLEAYHRIAANVPGVLYRFIVREDGAFEVAFISNGCQELFALEPNQVLREAGRLVQALDAADREGFCESLRAAARSPSPWDWEGRSGADKDPRWIKIAGRTHRLSGGDTEVDGLIMDITEQKRAERALELAVEELAETTHRERERAEALKEAHARLVEANRRIVEEQSKLIHAEKLSSIGRLAAGVAHEINNPLTGVMACVEALQSFNLPEDRRERYFETIRDGLERIKSVVQSLLDFAAPHKGEFHAVDVYPLVMSTVRLIQPEIVRRRLQMNVRIKRGRTWVRADRSQLMQAIMNVLLNAIHASPPNAEVRIRTKAEGSRTGIEIIDQGSGIPEELLGRVCEPFFTTKPQGEGTGLGLSVTLGIVEAHSGEIQIKSRVGVGTTVTLWLDTTEPPEDQRAVERAS
jgi:signal transduction histidine kinase